MYLAKSITSVPRSKRSNVRLWYFDVWLSHDASTASRITLTEYQIELIARQCGRASILLFLLFLIFNFDYLYLFIYPFFCFCFGTVLARMSSIKQIWIVK